MRRVLAAGGRSLTLSCLILGSTRAASGQAASIPLSLGVTASPAEITAGDTVTAIVRLKNYKGDAVPAIEPVPVALHSELSGDVAVTIAAGQSIAQASVRFPRGGVATLVATAPKMTSGSVEVVVKAAGTAKAAPDSVSAGPPAPDGRGDRSSPAPEAPGRATPALRPPVVGAPGPAADAVVDANTAPTRKSAARGATAPAPDGDADDASSLEVDVLPQHVHPSNASWRALVLVTAINATRQPVAVQSDTDVYLATDIGVVTPTLSRIQAGKARTTELIQLTSDRPGTGNVWAWTDTGILTQAAVEYHDAVPTQLLVRGLPSRAVNDGKTVVTVTVFLEDETAAAASADQDVSVKLTSSVGTPSPSDLSIPRGKFFGEAVLTSPTSGMAEITATAPRLKQGSAEVEFVFPLLLVTLAGTGGLVGSVVRSGRQLFTGAWWWHLVGSLGLGIVLGLLFYALALFGVIASIPKLAIPLAQLPTTNDLGALVLGFFGGYYARSWLPAPPSA
jgi:hypothetical protein